MIAMLCKPRTRRLLAATALLVAAAPGALLLTGGRAAAANSIDVYAVKGAGTAVRVTVQTGYSFVVEPDAMIPRATAAIEADQVIAVASPLDPGDGVDTLPGLGMPVAEGDIENGAATPNPLPGPLAGSTPPSQFTQAVDAIVSTFATTFNPTLTVPYEHAEATYPNPSGAQQERAVFPPPGPSQSNVPPQLPEIQDFGDPLGLVSVHSSLGSALAAAGKGIADAGTGSAIAIPALGLSIARVSSHVEMHGGNGGSATSSVVTSLQGIDIALPSSLPSTPLPLPLPSSPSAGAAPLLHIGSLVLTATTERAPGAAHATSHTSLQASGVTVAGVSARLDQNGITLNGASSPLNGPLQQLVNTVSSPECAPNPPVSVPNGPSLPASPPVLTIGLPTLTDQLTHHGNERSVSMTGPTLCLATIAPVPNTSGAPSPTPTIYTVTLGDVTSSAYGVSLPADTVATTLLPPMPETGPLDTSGNSTSDTVIDNSTTATQPPPGAPAGSPRSGFGRLLATLTGGILSPQVVVSVASLAELALLVTLWLSYRMAIGRRAGDDAASRLDLV